MDAPASGMDIRHRFLLLIGLFSCLAAAAAHAQPLDAGKFLEIVATPGDDQPLRRELAPLPVHRRARCEITITYADGRIFKETSIQTCKTIQGRYGPLHSIVTCDDRRSAILGLSLHDGEILESTINIDPVNKVIATMATYGRGMTEVNLTSYTADKAMDRGLIYENGVLALTREIVTTPLPPGSDPGAGDGK